MLIRLIVSLLMVLLSLPAVGQEPIPEAFLQDLARDLAKLQPPTQAHGLGVRIVNKDSPVYAGASTATEAITKLSLGDEARVIDNAGDWYAIQLPNNKSGWVQSQNVAPVIVGTGAGVAVGSLTPEQLEELGVVEPGFFQRQVLSLLERAATFRELYRDNPYVIVRGFDISLGFTGPSLGMSFEFKE